MTATLCFVMIGHDGPGEKMTRILLVALLALVAGGCSDNTVPADVLDKETFAEVYAALVENERVSGPQTLYNIRRYDPDTTLARLGVTREQIEHTIAYYNQDLRRWHEFYIEAMRKIEGDPLKKKEAKP